MLIVEAGEDEVNILPRYAESYTLAIVPDRLRRLGPAVSVCFDLLRHGVEHDAMVVRRWGWQVG